jgi:hypothetical protein
MAHSVSHRALATAIEGLPDRGALSSVSLLQTTAEGSDHLIKAHRASEERCVGPLQGEKGQA